MDLSIDFLDWHENCERTESEKIFHCCEMKGENRMDFSLTKEQLELQQWARNFAKEKFSEKAYTWVKRGEIPWENAKILAEHGLMGMTLPEEDGGQGSSLIDAIIVMEEIAKVCP